MSVIRFEEIGGHSLDRAEKMLAGFPGGMEKAVKSAMSRSLSYLRTNSTKEIRKVYAISAAALRTEENIKTKYTYHPGAGISGYVLFSGRKIPLYRYDGTSPVQPTQDTSKTINALIQGHWRQTHPGVAAAGHQKVNTSPTRFEDAFVARMKSGHVGIFERTGSATSTGNDALKEMMGSSVPQMVGNEDVQQALVDETMKKFDERLEHEINAIINSWR